MDREAVDDPGAGRVAGALGDPLKGTVLLVDDDDAVRAVMAEMLECMGLDVTSASGGKEALSCLRSPDASFDLVILDMLMPEMNGEQTFAEIRLMNPGQQMLICSGFSEDGAVGRLLQLGGCRFFRKPFRMASLHQAIAESLASKSETSVG